MSDPLLCSLEGAKGACYHSGETNGEATPVPIPNTEVKLSCAEDTWLETARKSRSSPDTKTRSQERVFYWT